MNKNNSNKKGQIMVITLLVLTILAIITVGLVVLVNKDITQVVSTDKYEQALNTSESQLNKVLDKFSKPSIAIAELTVDFAGAGGSALGCKAVGAISEIPGSTSGYQCDSTSKDFSDATLTTKILASDTKEVRDFQIYSGHTFDINLSGYTGILQFRWNNQAALEYTLVYKDSANTIQSIRDVFDAQFATATPPYVYDSFKLLNDTPVADPNNIHQFPFAVVAGGTPNLSVQFSVVGIQDLTGLPFTGTPISLRVTPRMTNPLDSISLSVTALGGNFPDQMRVFISKSYDLNDKNTPVANIETKVPLYPQPDSTFDYSIITNGVVKNSP